MRYFRKAALAALAIGIAAPAGASNDKTPPGNPCAKGNGNPCTGNNGNAGQQGNGSKGLAIGTAAPFTVTRPAVVDRSVYVTQIGTANTASISQSSPHAYAQADQRGERNHAAVVQRDGATAFARLDQQGLMNQAVVTQGGIGGNTLYLTQKGSSNAALSWQNAAAGENGAILVQNGNANSMALSQNGSDNHAQLTQNGDGNSMSATQNNSGNRLVWTQTGNNLSNLTIVQPGGQAMQITQSN